MRKIFYAVAAATLLFTSCAEVEIQVRPIVESTEDFTATVGADSRAHLDGTKVLWDETDQITIFTKTAHNRQYKIKSLDTDQRIATFGYVGFTGTDNTAISANYAIYPYDANATLSGDVITTTINAEQAYDAEKVDLQNAIMVAMSSTNEFSFVNAGALLRFKLCTENIPDTFTLNSIELASKAHALAGTATIDLAGDSKAVIADGVKEVSLTGIGATIDATEKLFYIALPATDFEAEDLTVTFDFAEGAKTLTLPAFALNQGSIKTISYSIKDAEDFTGTTDSYKAEVATAEELKSAIAAGRDVVLAADITLDEPIVIADKNITFDLNGYNIINKVDNASTDVIIVKEGATLTINGEGNVTAVSGNDGYPVIAAGEVIINGGYFKSGKDQNDAANACIYARGNGKIVINGGVFESEGNYTINKKDGDRATTTIEIKGGRFINFDPANNEAENAGTNFVAEGYISVEVEENVWEVFPATESIEVATVAALEDVLAQGGKAVLAADITVENALIAKGNTTLDLNGKTISQSKAVYVSGFATALVNVHEGTTTITGNGVIDARGYGDYAIEVRGGNLVIESGNIYADITAVNTINGTATINGGHFQVTPYVTDEGSSYEYTINCKDYSYKADTADIIVNGGSFYKFDPANNAAEGDGTNFVAEGKTSTAEGDWYIVK